MTKNKYVVIFDLFGTILDDIENNWQKSLEFLKNYVLSETTEDEILKVSDEFRTKYMSNRSITYQEAKMTDQLLLFKERIGFKNLHTIDYIEYQTFKAGRINKLSKGTIEILRFLKDKDYDLYVMSNTIYSVSTIKKYIKEFGILEFFEGVFTSSDFGYRKPSDKFFGYVYDQISKKTQIAKEDIFFIGNDLAKDVVGSKMFGFSPFWVSSNDDGVGESITNCVRVKDLKHFYNYLVNNYIYLCGIQNQYSTSDGPGNRLVVYFQGCDVKCEGCHNQDSWNINQGVRFSINQLTMTIITKLSRYVRNVTISGGEPIYQEKALKNLLIKLKKANLNICLYTSYEFFEVSDSIKKYLNYLKTGRYVKELRTTTNGYFGSSNQRMWVKEEENNWIEMQIK